MKNYRLRPLGPIGIEPPEARFLDTLDAIHRTPWLVGTEAAEALRDR